MVDVRGQQLTVHCVSPRDKWLGTYAAAGPQQTHKRTPKRGTGK